MRDFNRDAQTFRPLSIQASVMRHAEGSCLIKLGHTQVMCTASVEERVPPFLRGKGQGWLTAEYGMLPRSTTSRMEREAAKGKLSGRTQEIQRLIGRSLRAVLNPSHLGERQIRLDCDVIEADGGTRTAAITGAYVALFQACVWLMQKNLIHTFPLNAQVMALSCGLKDDTILLDLDYSEDANADVDANFVLTSHHHIIEAQASAEGKPFSENQLQAMLHLVHKAAPQIFQAQEKALGSDFRLASFAKERCVF